MINTIKSDEVHISTQPPASLGLTWYNPETTKWAYGIKDPIHGVLWLDATEKSLSAFREVNHAGYFSAEFDHGLTQTELGSFVTRLLITSGTLHRSRTWLVPTEKPVLGPKDTLKVRHYIGSNLSGVECKLLVTFREILEIVRN